MLRFQHHITTLCRVLRVNRSTYYKHYSSTPASRTLENQKLRSLILEIYSKYKKRFGAGKIQIILERDYGIHISTGRVYRLMNGMQLPKMSTIKPSYQKGATQTHVEYSNYLKQNFNPPSPNQVWASDITYIKTTNRFVYLCVIMDLFSRKIIAYRVHHRMDSSFVLQTVQDALEIRKPENPLLFHTDRGSQYTCSQMRQFCDSNNVVQSFSKKGHPWDNAVLESFFKYAKREELGRHSYQNITEVKIAVFKYIEAFYNNQRPHSANQMVTPNERERIFAQTF